MGEEIMEYFKKIDLYIYSCPILMAVSDEDKQIFTTILKICSYYKKISPQLIYEEFGLEKDVATNILKIMVKELRILDKISGSNESFYQLKPDIKENEDTLHNHFFKVPIVRKFSLSYKPLIFINIPIYANQIENPSAIEDLILPLNEINRIIHAKENSDIYNIPKSYLGLDLSNDIRIYGKNEGNLLYDGSSFILKHKRKIIARISRKHPEFSSLLKELEEIKKEKLLIEKNIKDFIQPHLKDIDFILQYEGSSENIIIQVNSSDLNDFGTIFQLYQRFNSKFYEIPLKKDWNLRINIQMNFNDEIIKFWLEFFISLLKKLNNKASSILNYNNNKLDLMLEDLGNNKKFDQNSKYNKDTLVNLIGIVKKEKVDDWFQILDGILNEGDIFE